MSKRRVVVTGLGLVSPLGCGTEHVWSRIIAGESGLAKIEHFDVSDLSSHVAGIIPRVDGRNGGGEDVPGRLTLMR
jgi:3-oxoacyl-[acyl-carrier-protein] synthase II